MPKNVMKLLKPSPHRARNDFDLSHRHVLDANFGEVLPVTHLEVVPGDNITFHASDLIRAIPFVSSPFLRAKQHIDVWFVPYHDLWHQFDAFITKKTEPVSSAFKEANYCPHISQYEIWQALNGATASVDTDIAGRDLDQRSYYLLQLLGYGDVLNKHGVNTDGTISSFKVNPFALAAYNYIWYNEYRQQYYDDGRRLMSTLDKNAAMLFNFDDLSCDTQNGASLTSRDRWQYTVRAMCQMRYRCWKKDLFTGLMPSTQYGPVSSIPVGDLTGLTAMFTGTQGSISVTGANTNTGEVGDSINIDTAYLHFDTLPNQTKPDSLNTSPLQVGWFNTPVRVNPDGSTTYRGRIGVNDGTDVFGQNSFTQEGGIEITQQPVYVHAGDIPVSASGTFTPQGSVTLSGSSAGLGFDMLSLRRSEAIQIWRENALRAGNHIKDNMLAHYGVASDFNDHRPTHLGSVSAPLNIGDVMATANSSTGVNNTVGDIAGKGLSSLDEKVFKFHAKDFGVIMVMMSILPEAEYDSNGIDRCNQLLEAEDFFVPEFENLGLEAVNSINIGPSSNGDPSESLVLGYAPRYYAYKTKLDKVFGQFVGNGIFRTWSSQRSDVTSYFDTTLAPSDPLPLKFLYINPALFNYNFNVGIDVSPQFQCDLYYDVDAVRPMSVIGLPFS